MLSRKNIFSFLGILVCLTASYYINKEAENKAYVNTRFIRSHIQGGYALVDNIKHLKNVKEGEEELVGRCFQLFDSLRVESNENWEGFGSNIRGQLLSIADSIGIEVDTYQSNISVWSSIISSLINCNDIVLKRGIRLLIYDYEILESDSVRLVLFPFRDSKDIENVDFFDSDRILEKKEIMNFRGDMSNIEARILNPVTLESKTL